MSAIRGAPYVEAALQRRMAVGLSRAIIVVHALADPDFDKFAVPRE